MAVAFNEALQDDLIRRIRDVVEPVRVILFGSVAAGRMGPNSDVDVLVVVTEGTKRTETAKRIYRNLIGYELPVDVIVSTESDIATYGDNHSLIFYPALREGRVIYGN
jgi:predicted nucleotidyltransferase